MCSDPADSTHIAAREFRVRIAMHRQSLKHNVGLDIAFSDAVDARTECIDNDWLQGPDSPVAVVSAAAAVTRRLNTRNKPLNVKGKIGMVGSHSPRPGLIMNNHENNLSLPQFQPSGSISEDQTWLKVNVNLWHPEADWCCRTSNNTKMS
ncbi:hypothetical protein B0H16DRAFT_1784835 [Mycena metata]|uniref:Uncharacterized protein n=1 Tax=Mycena metata TaxID=1033252 RepID=A0AAD7KHH0_9AGAR|nr:hypothetical protein B0H16DRAFT_1784835 [Mycena metata]